jgi:hypothetical protein
VISRFTAIFYLEVINPSWETSRIFSKCFSEDCQKIDMNDLQVTLMMGLGTALESFNLSNVGCPETHIM